MFRMTNFDFQIIPCNGTPPPKLSFHSCSLVRNKFYIFGGVDDKKNVQNQMFCFDPSTSHWSEVTSSRKETESASSKFSAVAIKEPPKLSHHTANVLKDRYILFLGGWTGHKRTSEAFYFDILENSWFQIEVKGDTPVGLSSHTATLVSENQLIIVGREGGVRTQRRSGDSFYFNVNTGVYKEAVLHASSRSGHTANLVKPLHSKAYKLFVQGGRKGSEYEVIGSWKHKLQTESGLLKKETCSLLDEWVECTQPNGRQHCVAVELNDKYILFFGGETWSGVRNNVTNEIFILDSEKMKWYTKQSSSKNIIVPCLTGHTMGIWEGKVYVFGGVLEGKCTNHVWLMQL